MIGYENWEDGVFFGFGPFAVGYDEKIVRHRMAECVRRTIREVGLIDRTAPSQPNHKAVGYQPRGGLLGGDACRTTGLSLGRSAISAMGVTAPRFLGTLAI